MRNLSAAFLMLAALLQAPAAAAAPAFKHIIVIVQENRTPDNLFGSNPHFEPGVDIAGSGKDSAGATIRLTPVLMSGCYDIVHSHASFEDAYTKGFDTEKLIVPDGCAVPADPQFKYVANSKGEVQPYFDIALQNGFANRMFQTNQGPSFPAHQFLFSGTSAPSADTPLFAAENPSGGEGAGCSAGSLARVALVDALGSETAQKAIYPCFEHQTLADLLDGASPQIGWRYYASDPYSIWTAPNAIRHICGPEMVKGALECAGADWVSDVVPDDPSRILSDIRFCKLQAVSWVTPTALASDHAKINNGSGPSWVASIINLIGTRKCVGDDYWKDTAIFVTWDDWGGWYDHVSPFQVVTPYKWGAGYSYGYRVPLLVVSAFTRPGQVSDSIFDFGSILAFIEHNFGLGFIAPATDRYTQYADYQATRKGRGDLGEFFGLKAPKAFLPIAAPLGAQYFIDVPKSEVDPDDD